MTDEQILAMFNNGKSRKDIAAYAGKTVAQVKHALDRARRDPLVSRVMKEVGSNLEPDAFWKKEDGVSAYYKKTKQDDAEFASSLIDSLSGYGAPLYAPAVNRGTIGDHLLVVDNADVHFGKLCVTSETNQEYNIDAARHRVIEGTRSLLNKAKSLGVGQILYVMGNDILNTDDGHATTSGTRQDVDGTYFTAYRAAQYAQIDAIKECMGEANTDLIHCMSNHDWRSGWTLSQTIAAHFRNSAGIRATDYNMSERHRKYYGYERNGIMLTHGDGTKEEKLTGHFMNEAREYMGDWKHLYAYLHHMHHKIAKRRGIDVFQTEKDHNGITAVIKGAPVVEGNSAKIEYVRSPSPADGWHDRNGYTNRQAVEVFLHHPHDGQVGRFTEWF